MPARGRASRSIAPSSLSALSWSGRRPAANTVSKASSNRSRSSWLEHSTARSASLASCREAVSTMASARWAPSSSPTPTRLPWERITAASEPTRSVIASDTFQDLALAHPDHVLADLQGRPQCQIEVGLVPQGQQRLSPDEGLPHAPLLVQVALLAQPPHGRHHA